MRSRRALSNSLTERLVRGMGPANQVGGGESVGFAVKAVQWLFQRLPGSMRCSKPSRSMNWCLSAAATCTTTRPAMA